jgi:hypothetical protein
MLSVLDGQKLINIQIDKLSTKSSFLFPFMNSFLLFFTACSKTKIFV